MPAGQVLLFPDPRPLVERLGRDFFRQLPQCAGVYLMHDAGDRVVYVGKAKNLRKRLGSYRVANPERMARRTLRLLSSVVRIELQPCDDEAAALKREAELLLALRPKFNRAGTWPRTPRFLACRHSEGSITFKIIASPEPEWRVFGPLGGSAVHLRAVLVRLLWLALAPGRGVTEMPLGWARGRLDVETTLVCGAESELILGHVEALCAGNHMTFTEWLRARLPAATGTFEQTVIDADLEFIQEIFGE